MSIGERINYVVVDELGIDPLLDRSYDAVAQSRVMQEYVVTDADQGNLPLIAYRMYGMTELWWAIVVFNGIADPFSVKSGTRLRIPMMNDLISNLTATRSEGPATSVDI